LIKTYDPISGQWVRVNEMASPEEPKRMVHANESR
jgi:hypothetical protein